jgi:serine/threonine protein kinase/Tol biopolymer transport system component
VNSGGRIAPIGPYHVLAKLGEGGMGEVYRATDTRLKRQVAIKILPPSFAADPDRLARFQREAEVLAAVSHPNICAVYGVEDAGGVRALVMELVEGPTLADRIALGPMPLDEALPIAQQIALAVEAAHEQGIVHRDLKPANIKVRPDGTVKVLDFGLAKAFAPQPAGESSDALAQSPTITSPAATGTGVILGTAAYMSPEQARGKAVDERTDIWSFGCVLYEMLTARRPFTGDSVADVITSILAREPDLSALPANTPQSIHRLLRRCLEKDRRERLHHIGDARIEIRDALKRADGDAAVVPQPSRASTRWLWVTIAASIALAIAAALLLPTSTATPPPEVRVEITTPPGPSPLSIAVSPDGRSLAFVASADGRAQLWLRSFETGVASAVPDTDGAEHPFWAPNGRSLAFFADDSVKRLDLDGLSVRTLATSTSGQGGSWNQDDVILIASLGRPISRIPAAGGDPTPVVGLVQQGSNFSPAFLPDGRHFLYYVRGDSNTRGVYVGHLESPLEPRRLLDSDFGAAFLPPGHVLFIRDRALLAQPFDPIQLRLSGTPIPVAENVAGGFNVFDVAAVSASANRVIAFRQSTRAGQLRFAWFDRTGKEIGDAGEVPGGMWNSPSLSLDGERVIGYRGVGSNPDVWVLDVARGSTSRLTTNTADDVFPVWSPAADRIIFSSNRTGRHQLYERSLSSSAEQLVAATELPMFATDWSIDGRFLMLNVQHPKTRLDVWALDMQGDRRPFPVVNSAAAEQQARLSPDGKWIAYQSDESGRAEIYIQPFPGPGARIPVSTRGGTQVRWRQDGRELFYVDLEDRIMSVPIRSSSTRLDVERPALLFTARLGNATQRGDYRTQYVVSKDGQRFLAVVLSDSPNAPISLILNWRPKP